MSRIHYLAATALTLTMPFLAHAQSPSSEAATAVLPQPTAPFAGTIGTYLQGIRLRISPGRLRLRRVRRMCCSSSPTTPASDTRPHFGGAAATPTLDRLAANGLRYNRLHTTALCSPTRAALLDRPQSPLGRHRRDHRNGHRLSRLYGHRAEDDRGACRSAAAERLRHGGLRQVAQHARDRNQPGRSVRPMADREHLGLRILLRLQTRARRTNIIRCSTATRRRSPPPRTPEQGYHFTEDMADEAIAWINSVNATNPNKPWFLYFSTAGVHAPHHAPKAYRDKYKGQVRRRLGQVPRGDVRSPESSSASFPPTRS